jgi:hypothetical protein
MITTTTNTVFVRRVCDAFAIADDFLLHSGDTVFKGLDAANQNRMVADHCSLVQQGRVRHADR